MITQENYLDLGNFFINEFIGDPILAGILLLVFIAYMGVKYQVPAEVTMILCFLGVGLITSYYFNGLIWFLTVFVLGIIIYSIISKLMKK